MGVGAGNEESWQGYGGSVIAFSAVALLLSYGIFRLQGSLPFNPQHLPGVGPALSWNTAVSFVTNTNWQADSGDTTIADLSQIGALAVQTFPSTAVVAPLPVAPPTASSPRPP